MTTPTDLENHARQTLLQLLADMNNPQEINDFLTTFLKETDVQNLAKRVAILQLLEQNASYEEIQKQLTVSSATVSTMVQIGEQPIGKRVLERMHAHKWAEQMSRKIMQFFNPDRPQSQTPSL